MAKKYNLKVANRSIEANPGGVSIYVFFPSTCTSWSQFSFRTYGLSR
jgi:hypothetical protein